MHDPDDPTSLSYPVCRKVYKDSEGVMWFGTGWAWEPNIGRWFKSIQS